MGENRRWRLRRAPIGSRTSSERARRAPRALSQIAFAAILGLLGFALIDVPVQAQAAGPTSWELPEGVERVAQRLALLDAEGNTIGYGPAAPGRTFHYSFLLENTSSEAVTVTGFESNFTVTMHPDRQGSFPADHCMQFFETRDFGVRQTFPVVVEPGETVQIDDNASYHYIYGPVSNECQQASFFFGPPVFAAPVQIVTAEEPVWRDESCSVPGAVTIPSVEGVAYSIDGAPAEPGEHEVEAPATVTVTASALSGFELEGAAGWSHEFSEPSCGGGDDDDDDGSGENGGEPPAAGDPTPPVRVETAGA